jgi:TolA-binding protein
MASDISQDDGQEEASSASGGRLASLVGFVRGLPSWAAAHRVKAVLLAGACLVFAAAVAATWFLLAAATGEEEVTLEMALEALDYGDFAKARELAKKLQESDMVPHDAMGGPLFVLGAANSYEADASWSPDTHDLYLLSVRYLEQARDLGFPPDRQGEGLFLLGKNLSKTGQIPASRPVLREALQYNPQRESLLRWLLAEAYLNDANPKCEEALEQNTFYLADETLLADDRNQGLIQRARIQFRLGEKEACLKTLDEIPEGGKDLADSLVVRGQILLSDANQGKQDLAADEEAKENKELLAQKEAAVLEKYQEAVEMFRTAQGRDTLSTQASRKAMYLIGVCFKELGDYARAMEEFARTYRAHADTPEAMAADFEIAELSRRLEQDTEALQAYRRTLGSVTDVRNYSNPWITLNELRNRSIEAHADYMSRGKFDEALELVKLFYPLFTQTKATELRAETQDAWGRYLMKQAEQLGPRDAEPLRREARERFRLAGRSYAKLARLRTVTKQYPDDLWNSAERFMEGQGYADAVPVLREYLQNESRRRHPRALLYLGEALLNLDKTESALTAFEECIEFHPRDAAAYSARLLAAHAHAEMGEFERAEALLQENLNGAMAPASPEWRDSLFALGLLHYRQKHYEDAVRRLEEVVLREPQSPHAIEARYLVGKCNHQLADEARQKLEGNLVESRRVAGSRKVRELLDSALLNYQEVQDILNQRQESAELTELEKKTLRNCYFAVGAIQFELGKYEEAIKAYTTMTSRYQNSPESLEAYVQIARAHRRLDRPDRARGTLEQAKVVLNQMQAAGSLDGSGNHTSEEWAELLGWLEAL